MPKEDNAWISLTLLLTNSFDFSDWDLIQRTVTGEFVQYQTSSHLNSFRTSARSLGSEIVWIGATVHFAIKSFIFTLLSSFSVLKYTAASYAVVLAFANAWKTFFVVSFSHIINCGVTNPFKMPAAPTILHSRRRSSGSSSPYFNSLCHIFWKRIFALIRKGERSLIGS